MPYKSVDDSELIPDLLSRKEFYWTKRWHHKTNDRYNDIIPRFLLDDAISKSNNLTLHSYQLFIQNYINPNTPYKRMLMKWETGTGKTIGALSIAMNFIDYYRSEKDIGNIEIGSVFIIGFSDRVFKNELLRFPEFGFLSKEEKHRLDKLKKQAALGNQVDITKYYDTIIKIKKRFSNRKGNGFFKFYGYKAFVNRIFKVTSGLNLNNMSEEEIRRALADGRITYDEELLAQFKNSLIICDEIHTVYNSIEKNNWGIAIQAVLDYEPSCRAVFMSATPINNNATEVIDLLNLLLPKEKRQTKSDFFDNNNKLKPNATEKIAELVQGRISFLRDVNPKYYPSISMEGDTLHDTPYLKFVRCPMSDFHYNTYKKVYNGALSQDSQYLMDFALENPDSTGPNDIGIYQTNQIKKLLADAPQKWKDKYGLDFRNEKIVGDGLKYENLKKYSSKYVKLLDEIENVIAKTQGKIFIYHNIVHISGVLFIEQILIKNGYLDEFSAPSDNTICMRCGKIRKEHQNITGSSENSKGSSENSKGSSENSTKGDVYKIQIRRKGHKYYWMDHNNEILLMTIHKKKRSYNIKSNSIDDKLFDNEADIDDVFGYFNDKPIKIQILKSNKKILKLFLGRGFNIDKYTKKHIWIINNKVTGGCLPCKNGSRPELFGENLLVKGGAGKPNIKISKVKVYNHQFTPARFIMAHSDIDKAQMEHSLEKFNSTDNADGSKYMMLVGSKIIKESYDIKAIQNVFIMSRPDNIPTLIQIRGRAVRKNSHRDLPLDKRIVHFKVFTTCLPIKQTSGHDKGSYALSYEEEKYREKIFAFQTIQQIEKVLHENAIDSYINYDLITRKPIGDPDPLSALPYELKANKKFSEELTAEQLNLSTFNIYFAHAEIEIIKTIIKRLFIEKLSVWEYHDLYTAVKDAVDYETEINTKLFTEDNFLIALNQLIWNSNPKFIEPLTDVNKHNSLSDDHIEQHIQHSANTGIVNHQLHMNNIVDRLYNSDDKIITLPGGQDSIITSIYISTSKKQYYILFPLNDYNGQPEIDLELPYRIIKQEPVKTINMNSFIQTKRIDFDYDDKKKIFYRKYADISIENMENVVCEYGTTFHIKFLDECIEYVFNTWTNPKSEKSDMHEFYFKMLYYYDLLSLVMWAYTCKPRLFKEYIPYALPVKAKDIKLKTLTKYEKRREEIIDISPDDNSDLATSGVINLLKTSLNRTSNVWIPAEFRDQFDKTIAESLSLYAGKKKKNKGVNKVSGMLLPVGHYIGKFPRVYHPEKGWTEDPTYVQSEQEFIENDLIVGYDERSKTGVHIRFKLRAPMHNIKKYKDTRLIEKGTVCKSKSKSYLRNIAKILDITIPDKVNVDELCMLIRAKLIRFELKERIKKSKIKYFYFHYENSNPIE